MSKLEAQYKQNIQAYKDLGLEIPATLEEVRSKLTKQQHEAISKGTGQLVICPAITKDFTFFDLIDHFDKKQSENTWVYKDLWEQYDLEGTATINVIDLTVGNKYKDPVTQHTDKTLQQQRKIKDEFMSPVEAIVLAAIFRLDNKQLAPNTWIRFPQLPDKTVGGDSLVGVVDSGVGGFRLGRSGGVAGPGGGVGLSVGQRIELQPSPLPSAITEAQAISLLKKAGYKVMREY